MVWNISEKKLNFDFHSPPFPKHKQKNHKQIFGDFHHLRHSRVAKRSISPADEFHHRNLTTEPEVRSLSQQRLLRRVKRDFIPISLRSREGSLKPRFDDPKWPQMWYLVG